MEEVRHKEEKDDEDPEESNDKLASACKKKDFER